MISAQALILISTCASTLSAQQGGLNRPSIRDSVRAIEMKEMDRQLLLAPLPSKNNSEAARLLALRQIKEDFKGIQGLNNAMMANAWAREEMDYHYISDSVSQIRTKATRLKSNLALPEAKNVDDQQIENAAGGNKEVRLALLALDRSVMRFVTNPLFRKSNVVDVSLAAQASRDLRTVIDLCGSIKKTAGRLNKFDHQP